MRTLTMILVLLALPGPALAQSQPPSHAYTQAQPPLYDFRIGFWRNLHHTLYAQASSEPSPHRVRRIRLAPGDQAVLAALDDGQRSDWAAARDAYAQSWIGQHLLFDAEMRQIGEALSQAGDADEPPTSLPPDLRNALILAAPIYRQSLWPAHRAQGAAWVAALEPRLAQHGASLRRRLTDLYGAPWPDEPIVVEIAAYASAEGAYTSLGPTRITVASGDAANAGDAALEILMHETSHAMAGPLQANLSAHADAASARPGAEALRRDLWHEALFYLTGEAVAEVLPGYTPYADSNGLWARVWTGPDRAALEATMTPLLSGEASLDSALSNLVDRLAGVAP